jgi:hypothetical protein
MILPITEMGKMKRDRTASNRRYHLDYIGRPESRQKMRARQQCAYAIQTGKLKRLPCEVCGSGKSQAHHSDYSRPLDVRFLCYPCHSAEHFGPKSEIGGLCRNGHRLTPETAYVHPTTDYVYCLECARKRDRIRNKNGRGRTSNDFLLSHAVMLFGVFGIAAWCL